MAGYDRPMTGLPYTLSCFAVVWGASGPMERCKVGNPMNLAIYRPILYTLFTFPPAISVTIHALLFYATDVSAAYFLKNWGSGGSEESIDTKMVGIGHAKVF